MLPVFGDGRPAVWRWSAAAGSTSAPTTWCAATIQGKLGERVDVFQRDWLHRDGGRRKKLRTIWLAEEVGSTDTAVAELKDLVGHVFESPKPTGLVRRILGTMPADVRVLDSFAGSGTTGHAVALANAEDGGTRHCLSINSAEPTRPGSNADLAGLPTVAAITRARLRRRRRPARGRLQRAPAAFSSAVSSSSRWPSSRCRCGTVRRQPVRPKPILPSYDVQVMLSAIPLMGMESG